MEITLIRHPVTKWNIYRKVQPVLGGDISKRGYLQRNCLLKRLDSEEFDAVYSSDSHRCLEVAEKISKKYTLPLLTNEFFRERSHGVYEGKSLDELETFLDNQKGDMQNVRVPNGESLKDLYLRAIEGCGAIVGGNFNKPVLISHGSFLKMFLGYLLNMNPVQSNNCLKFSNCAISKIRHQKEGDWRIEYLNNRDFIPKNLR